MIDAYINGIRQIPGIDYSVRGNSVSFSQAPAAGAEIQMVHNLHSVANIQGDGSTYLFHGTFEDVERQDDIVDMLHHALKYRDNPAVAEALERLSVVVTLVKE
jgi:hypothetical protein